MFKNHKKGEKNNMVKKCKRLVAIAMVICTLLANSITAFAASGDLVYNNTICGKAELDTDYQDGVGYARAQNTAYSNNMAKLELFYSGDDGDWHLLRETGYASIVCVPNYSSYVSEWTDDFMSTNYIRSSNYVLLDVIWLYA